MKIHFEDNLDYQQAAIESVCGLFEGHEQTKATFSVSAARDNKDLPLHDVDHEVGGANSLDISDLDLHQNLMRVQARNAIAPSAVLESRDFTIEMETGTGKTYVYLRTILELNKRFGFTKFVVVVPSVAIKEGVHKTLQITKSHFKALYEGAPYRYFTYDSSRMNDIYSFALSGEIEIMITTVGAINKKEVNNLYREDERGAKPIDLIRATRPILIVDEPQSVDGGLRGAGKLALERMGALATLRYSATHVDQHHMIYRLNAVDAYEKRLVKQVEVAATHLDLSHNSPYVRFVRIRRSARAISAEIEVDARTSSGSVRRQRFWVQDGNDLEQLTGRAIYANHSVGAISSDGDGSFTIELKTPTIELYLWPDDTYGDIDPLVIQRQMIRRTIKEHLDKEVRLAPRGIKVLSLFFIDKVENYRYYAEDGIAVRGVYAEIFDEEYRRLSKNPAYVTLFHAVDSVHSASDAHDGYFSIDRNGGWTDTSVNGQGSDAERGYNLIMRDKERLLSFSTPLRFIFSHSALREGWDNPNIFQICSLRSVHGEVARRQTLGRGLRLCVDQGGKRIRDENVNVLTVIANEEYQDYAEALQKEIEDDSGIKFGVIDVAGFASVMLSAEDGGDPSYLGIEGSRTLWQHFRSFGYITEGGRVTDKLRAALAERSLNVPEALLPVSEQILRILERTVRPLPFKNADDARIIPVRENVFLSEDFKELWARVKAKTVYRLNFDTEELIDRCATSLRLAPAVSSNRLKWEKATLSVTPAGVTATAQNRASTVVLEESHHGLPDILTELESRTQLTRRSLASILIKSKRLNDFKKNPELFINLASDIINRSKRLAVIDGIKYERAEEDDFFDQDLLRSRELRGYIKDLVLDAKRSVYTDVLIDSGVERKFAEELEADEEVAAFVKLPNWFKVPTPLGSYNPDWAVVSRNSAGERVFFVVETKGSINFDDLRSAEQAKVRCGKAHFAAIEPSELRYQVAGELADLERIG